MTRPFGLIRRFRFNLPQRIAAGLLLLFLAQGLWVTSRQTLSDRDYQYARCGRETWEKPSPLAGYYTSCGNIHDGILAYRLAGLPLTLNLLAERVLDSFRKPEDRVVQSEGEVSAWELRHQLTHILLLLRLPFLLAGCVLGAGLWWVTRRLYGNLGGYTALALYCFSPPILKACVTPTPEILAALGVYGAVYTCIGVAHAMQGPRRKWRPRIVLLTAVFGVAAASHIAALPDRRAAGTRSHALGCRRPAEPGLSNRLDRVGGCAALRLCLLRLFTRCLQLRLSLRRRLSLALARSGAALLLHPQQRGHHHRRGLLHSFSICGVRRSRYFGNTAPLLCALPLLCAGHDRRSRHSVALGPAVSAHLCRRRLCRCLSKVPRGRLALAAAGAVVALQAIFCVLSLPGLL